MILLFFCKYFIILKSFTLIVNFIVFYLAII